MVIATNFPAFHLGTSSIKFVYQFKYLGHIISCNQRDDEHIQREIRNMFIRTNIMARRFNKCSTNVKVLIFKSFCLCLLRCGAVTVSAPLTSFVPAIINA